MNDSKSIFKNEYLFSIITKILMVIVGLVHSAIFARYVGSKLKGELSFIVSLVTTGSIIMTFGIHHAYPFYRKQSNDLTHFISSFVSTVFSFYFLVFICGSVLSLIVQCALNVQHAVLVFLLMLLWCYNRVMGYVVLVEKPNTKNKALLLFTILETILVVSLYFSTKASFLLGIICCVFIQVLEFVFYNYWLRRYFSLRSVCFGFLMKLISYGFFPMLALLLNTLNYRIDVLMLKWYPSVGDSQIGIYSIGIVLAEKVLLIPDALQEILLSKLAKNKGPEEVSLVCRLTFPLCLLISVAIIVLGKPFINILYGSEYNGAYLVTVISVIGTAFMVFYKMISQYNIVNKKQRLNIVLLSVGVLVNIVLNCVLVPRFGINGAAIATCFGFLSCSILFVAVFSKGCGINIRHIIFPTKEDLIMIKRTFALSREEKTF